MKSRWWVVLAAVSIMLAACFCRELSHEFLAREDPGCGNLLTFASFVFISIEGFIFTTRFGTVAPKVPFRSWTYLVLMYFVVSVANNYALNFNISMPLHMIFRAGSLMANMVLGMVLLKRRYSNGKYVSVIMISVGIATCTIVSSGQIGAKKTEDNDSAVNATAAESESTAAELEASALVDVLWWCVGISILTVSLFVSSRMGIYQEVIYKKHGKYPREALFYSHCLPLPMFLLLAPNINTHWLVAINSPLLSVFGYFSMPRMIAYLCCNVLTQFLCISSVFVLTSECASLTVTLLVTLRKFVSLLFSIWYFDNPFTTEHWVGTALVFSGTVLFTEVPRMVKEMISPPVKEEKKTQ